MEDEGTSAVSQLGGISIEGRGTSGEVERTVVRSYSTWAKMSDPERARDLRQRQLAWRGGGGGTSS